VSERSERTSAGTVSELTSVGAVDSLSAARRLAETLIYEGYLLYPYRASSQKNQVRWQWGVLVPPSCTQRLAEFSTTRAELLVEPRKDAELTVEVRFLQLQARAVQRWDGSDFQPTDSLRVDGIEHTEWDEGAEVHRTFTVRFAELADGDHVEDVVVPDGVDTTELTDAAGALCGRLVRTRRSTRARITVRTEALPGPYGAVRLSVRTENASDWDDPGAQRPEALRRALLGAHSVLACSDGPFLSLLDPPHWAKPAVAACVNERVWPVLVGEVGREVVLCSPIILYDHPEIAADSPGDLYDALEIDEILSLRTMTLTDEEKRQARATDPRAAAIIDRVDAMPQEMIDKLHGEVRYLRGPNATDPALAVPWDAAAKPSVPWWDPASDTSVSPETDSVTIEGVPVKAGSKLRLVPGRHRRSDAQDAFLVGRIATVQAVLFDVDEGTHLAVTVDDDPGAELQQAHGRFLYFQPDEVEPLASGETAEVQVEPL